MTMREDIKYCGDYDLGVIGQKLMIPRGANKPAKQYRERLLAAVDRREGGGSAFGEFKQAGECSIKTGGLTIRDYFAAKALAAGISTLDMGVDFDEEVFARQSYEIADAMLRERAK